MKLIKALSIYLLFFTITTAGTVSYATSCSALLGSNLKSLVPLAVELDRQEQNRVEKKKKHSELRSEALDRVNSALSKIQIFKPGFWRKFENPFLSSQNMGETLVEVFTKKKKVSQALVKHLLDHGADYDLILGEGRDTIKEVVLNRFSAPGDVIMSDRESQVRDLIPGFVSNILKNSEGLRRKVLLIVLNHLEELGDRSSIKMSDVFFIKGLGQIFKGDFDSLIELAPTVRGLYLRFPSIEENLAPFPFSGFEGDQIFNTQEVTFVADKLPGLINLYSVIQTLEGVDSVKAGQIFSERIRKILIKFQIENQLESILKNDARLTEESYLWLQSILKDLLNSDSSH